MVDKRLPIAVEYLEWACKQNRTIKFNPERDTWTLNGEFTMEEIEDYNEGIKYVWFLISNTVRL